MPTKGNPTRSRQHLTERTTRKHIERELNILAESLPEYKVGYNHYAGRFVMTFDHQEIGHHLTAGEFYSVVYGINCLKDKIRQQTEQHTKSDLADFWITKLDILECLEQQNCLTQQQAAALTEQELKHIADKAMDYITEDMHKAIADAYDNYMPAQRKEELTK